MDDENALKKVVDKSGFPLQIAIEHMVSVNSQNLGWRVQYIEHAWKNELSNSEGFIDLVLENKARKMALVVECKRVQEASWIFLNVGKQLSRRRMAKWWISTYEGGRISRFGWEQGALDPDSVQSSYCCIFGHDSKSQPMLERIGSTLVSSTEALANEESITLLCDRWPCRSYLNVIVTTAKLKACCFDPADISVRDGVMENCDFFDVPYVRFQKQLATHSPSGLDICVGNSHEVSQAKENTVFVVNSEHLLDFITALEN